MSKKNTQSNNSSKAANVAPVAPVEIAPVAAQDPQTNPTEEKPEFEKVELFPVLSEGAKFEINGYKVEVTKKEYLKDEKFPFTAWDATVVAPDGTEKTFSKVRNTAIRNYCHATSGITHNGNGERAITKVLSDMELAAEVTRRCSQIRGLLDRAKELYGKYTGGSLELPEIDLNTPILDTLTKENEARRESAEKAKAANAERTARKEARDLTAEISKLIAAGDFQKAAELMQQKANATKATEDTESPENGDESTK